MRLDLFLKVSRLVSSRSTAQHVCDLGLVSVNGAAAKPSKEVKVGDSVVIDRRGRQTTVEIVVVPSAKQVSREQAATLYRLVSDIKKDPIDDLA